MARKNSKSAFVKFERVQKSYDGETLVVKDLNLEIPKGEFLTMLGPSGAGISTCLMMLAGFETATHGEIMLNGISINNIPPHKRGIGMVFQNYALFPHMSVAENLSFPLEVRKLDKTTREEKVNRALDMVEMGDFKGAEEAFDTAFCPGATFTVIPLIVVNTSKFPDFPTNVSTPATAS